MLIASSAALGRIPRPCIRSNACPEYGRPLIAPGSFVPGSISIGLPLRPTGALAPYIACRRTGSVFCGNAAERNGGVPASKLGGRVVAVEREEAHAWTPSSKVVAAVERRTASERRRTSSVRRTQRGSDPKRADAR